MVVLRKNDSSVLTEDMKPFPDLEKVEKFITYHYFSNSESVNVFDVVGSTCKDYQGFTWLSMLNMGKKMSHKLSLLASNPWYYFEQKKKEPEMHYTKINDEIYISGQGNHRTAICKVPFYYTEHMIIHGITYEEYRVDFDLINEFSKLNALLFKKFPHIEIKTIRNHTKREDAPGWYRDYYNTSFLLINHKKNKQIEIASSEINSIYEDFLKINRFNKFFLKSKIKTIL